MENYVLSIESYLYNYRVSEYLWVSRNWLRNKQKIHDSFKDDLYIVKDLFW